MSGWWFVGVVITAVIALIVVSIRRQLRQSRASGDGLTDQRDLHGHIEGIFRDQGRPI